MKRIVLTGGGTAGHVTPNLALLPSLQEAGFEITYMGSYDGIEKRLIEDFNLPYVHFHRKIQKISGCEESHRPFPCGERLF